MSHCSYRALREVETQPQAVGDLKDERSLESGGEADYPLTEQNPGEVRCRKRTSTRWPSAALALLSLIVLALFGGDDLLSSLGIGGVGTRHGCSKVPSRLKTSTFVPTNYSVVEGIFIQDSPDFDGEEYDLLSDSFGLLDKTEDRWKRLTARIHELNGDSDDLTAYKLIYLARHGEGYHNVAEAKYGKEAWDCYWSEKNGDGELEWGPDPDLSPKGVGQAEKVNRAWRQQMRDQVPLPSRLYSSPLRRSARTLELTWSDILIDTRKVTPLIQENWRETIGLHTCDKRSSKSTIQQRFPRWTIERTFSEHDELWNPIYQENEFQQALRTQQMLNQLFALDDAAVISINAHGGTINAFFKVVGHRRIPVQTGGFVPILVKAVGHPSATQPVITGGQSATQPACSATKTPSVS